MCSFVVRQRLLSPVQLCLCHVSTDVSGTEFCERSIDILPVLSSIVTDSFVHFIKNLPYRSVSVVWSQPLILEFSTWHALSIDVEDWLT